MDAGGWPRRPWRPGLVGQASLACTGDRGWLAKPAWLALVLVLQALQKACKGFVTPHKELTKATLRPYKPKFLWQAGLACLLAMASRGLPSVASRGLPSLASRTFSSDGGELAWLACLPWRAWRAELVCIRIITISHAFIILVQLIPATLLALPLPLLFAVVTLQYVISEENWIHQSGLFDKNAWWQYSTDP